MGLYLLSLPRFIVVTPVVLLLVGGLLCLAVNMNSKGKWYNIVVGGFGASVFFAAFGFILYYIQLPDVTVTGQIKAAEVVQKVGGGYKQPYLVTLKKGDQKITLNLQNEKSGSVLTEGNFVDVTYNENMDILSVKYSGQ